MAHWLRHCKIQSAAMESTRRLSVDPVFAFGGITEGEFSATRRDLRIAFADCLRCDFLPERHMASTEIRGERCAIRGLLVKPMVQMKHRRIPSDGCARWAASPPNSRTTRSWYDSLTDQQSVAPRAKST